MIDTIYWKSNSYIEKNKNLSGWSLYVLYVILGILYYAFRYRNLVIRRDSCWVLVNLQTGYRFSAPTFRELSKGTPEYRRRMSNIYELQDFVEVKKGDVVIDIGSYLGTFSKMVADEADTVLAIDPYYAFGDCHHLNLAGYDNIHLIPNAVWNKQTTIELNLSRNPSENSILEVDSRATGDTVQVEANTISGILDEEDVSKVDFLKIEAEGVEPEILEGGLEMNPSKISIQANEERNGEDSLPEVIELLCQEDYEIRTEDKMVYARSQ